MRVSALHLQACVQKMLVHLVGIKVPHRRIAFLALGRAIRSSFGQVLQIRVLLIFHFSVLERKKILQGLPSDIVTRRSSFVSCVSRLFAYKYRFVFVTKNRLIFKLGKKAFVTAVRDSEGCAIPGPSLP